MLKVLYSHRFLSSAPIVTVLVKYYGLEYIKYFVKLFRNSKQIFKQKSSLRSIVLMTPLGSNVVNLVLKYFSIKNAFK